MDAPLKLTPTESVSVRSSTTEVLEVEGEWGPGGSAPPKHFHPAHAETFEVLAGSLRFRVDGEQRDVSAGDTIEVPRDAVHQVWNPGTEPARALWRSRPAGRTEDWFRAVDRLHREGHVGAKGMPGLLVFGVLLTEYRDVFRLALAPEPVQRGLLGALGAMGRLRGYCRLARTDG